MPKIKKQIIIAYSNLRIGEEERCSIVVPMTIDLKSGVHQTNFHLKLK